MADVALLDSIKAFLEKKVTPSIKLQKANDHNAYDYELVNPSVHIGWIPPKEYLIEEVESVIPCIIVGFDEGEDDGQEAGLKIRLSFVVYSPGEHIPDEDENISFTPNFQGYRDLINLLEKTKHALINNRIIQGATTLEYPFKWGMYQDQPYPYWYGWLTFKAKREPTLYITDEISKLL